MFSTLGLFKNIPCPKQIECSIPNCFFEHTLVAQDDTLGLQNVYDPSTAGEPISPPPKRRRLVSPKADDRPQTGHGKVSTISRIVRKEVDPRLKTEPQSRLKPSDNTNRTITERDTIIDPPTSITRNVSPPPIPRAVSQKAPEVVLSPIRKESLIPRAVSKSAVLLKTRMTCVEQLHRFLKLLNTTVENNGVKELVLSEQELITEALNEEQDAAIKSTSDVYRNTLAHRMMQLKKMPIEQWQEFVQEKWRPKPPSSNVSGKKQSATPLITGLASAKEEILVLRNLQTELEGLETFGYVTKSPAASEVEVALTGIRSAAGYETCDRCGIRFQVFPGRNEEGQLTTKGECIHHWGRIVRAEYQKTDRITGQSEPTFSCCSRTQGSEGCTRAPTHVFKVTDPKRLATVLQFERTPSTSTETRLQPDKAITFDCEMGYTTHGLELIRVTALSWPDNQVRLDVLVRPYGEILDLNTRFSGVTQEQFSTAPEHTSHTVIPDAPSQDSAQPNALHRVSTPAQARALLCTLLTPTTPLLGHAIENDLNAIRLIHPFVVDTVLLFPHPGGLPRRYGLKYLAGKYLGRAIQMGGEAGHDSKEDAEATADLVRVAARDKWKEFRVKGWKMVDGLLVGPDGQGRAEDDGGRTIKS